MLGIVSDIDWQNEIAKSTSANVARSVPDKSDQSDTKREVEIIDINRGRGHTKEVPEEIRNFIASEAIAGADPNQLSESFGISKSSISAYKHSATSTASYHSPDESLEKSNNLVRDRIVGPAQSRLIKAIEAITDSKLDSAKVQIAAQVAKNMSGVIKDMMPDPSVTINQNRVIVYRPRLLEESDFEIISVNE